jgi:hypothetical protein
MNGPLLTLGTFLALQCGAAIWWASRISSEMRAVTVALAALAVKVDKLEASVTTHETAIAILRAMNDYERNSLNGSGHDRAR